MATLTKRGAREVTDTLDRIANLFQSDAATLGLDAKIANDMAYRCDLLSDHIEKFASAKTAAADAMGQDLNSQSEFNPSDIGREVAGPLEMLDSDEPFMKGHFTQQNNRDLRELQQSGKMGPLNPEPAAPQAGKQASKQDVLKKVAAMEAALRTLKAELAEDDAKEEKKAEEKIVDDEKEACKDKTASTHGFNLTAE